jgi:hypothetical protein
VTDGGVGFIWDAETLKLIVALQGHNSTVADAQFDKDGKRVLTASWDGTARIWDAVTGKELMLFKTNRIGGLYGAGFDPSNTRIVTGSLDGTARIWDVQSGAEIVALRGHASELYSVAFSPDGRRLLTSSGDKTARIWDVSWATLVRGDELRRRVCGEKLLGAAQEFTDAELADPVLRGIDKDDPVARNPCLRRGPLSLDYWTRLPGALWKTAHNLTGRN